MIQRYFIPTFLFLFFLATACSDVKNEEVQIDEGDELAILNKKIQEDSSDASLYMERAEYYYNRDLNNLALQDIDRAIKKNNEEVSYRLFKADILLDSYESKDAIAVLEQAKEDFPESDEVRINLAHFQFIIKEYLSALTNLNQVIARNPQNPHAYFERGLIYDEVGDTANAMKNYQRVTELDADYREAWMGIGYILLFQGNEIAIKAFQNAIDIDPEREDAYLAIANFYHQHDKLEQAKAEYLKIIQRFPQFPPSQFNVGLLYLEQDSLEKAYQAFNRTLEIDPDNGNAFLYRGITQKIMGNIEAARSDFEQAMQLLPLDDDRAEIELNSLD